MTRPYLLTALLLDALETEGRKLGTGAQLRVQELLRRLPDEVDDEELCLALSPLLARNPHEQAQVYEKWEECRRRADELIAHAPPPPVTEAVAEAKRAIRRWRWRMWLPIALLLLGALGVALWLWRSPQRPVRLAQEVIVNTGQTAHFCPTDFPASDSLPGKVATLSIRYARTLPPQALKRGEGGPQDKDPTRSGASALGAFLIQNDSCLLYTAGDRAGRDSLVLSLVFSDGKKAELHLRVYVSPRTEAQPLPAQQPEKPQTAALFSPKPLPHPHDIRALAVERPADWVLWLARWWPWLRWAVLGLTGAALYAAWQYREQKRRKLVAELRSRDKPPYVWNIRIPGADQIVMGDAFAHLLKVMRRRAAADHWRLDLRATIAATAEQGGIPHFRYRQQTRPVDYLLLLDRQGPYNHRAQLYDALYRAFREQEIEIARFFFDSDIRHCYNEDHPNGLYLSDLAQRYPDARLIVVGTGAQIISPLTGRLEAWAGVFHTWAESALLSPRPSGEWGRQEQRLGECFQAVLPASLQSLHFWIEETQEGEEARFGEWREQVHDAPAAFWQPDPEVPLPLLQLQYDERMLRWIALCAIYPSLHYDLTVWLGRIASPDLTILKKLSNPTHPVTLADLTDLFRLRWFVEGQIPQTARAALLDWLQAEDPELLARTRLALAELLRQSPPPQDSVAYNDHAQSVALNEWLATADARRRKELEKQIAQHLDAGAEADFVTLGYLEQPRGPLDFVVPETWKKYVHPGKMPALGNRLWPMLALIAGLLALWGAGDWRLRNWLKEKMNTCKGQSVEYVTRPGGRLDKIGKGVPSEALAQSEALTLCLDSPEDTLLWQERQLLDAIEDCNAARFDALERDMDPPKVSDTLMEQVTLNVLTAFFNNGVYYAEKNQRDSACYWVRRGNLDLGQGMVPFEQKKNISDLIAARDLWCNAAEAADTSTAQTDFRLLQYPEAGVEVSFMLLRPRPAHTYTLQPEAQAGSLVFKSGVQRYTYPKAGAVVARLFEDGQLLRSRVVTVARKPNISEQSPVIEEGNTAPPAAVNPVTPSPPGGADGAVLPAMLRVPGGTFRMGSPDDDQDAGEDERPAHDVILSDFEIGKYEVTNAEYAAFLNESGNQEEGGVDWINLESSLRKEKCRIQSSDGKVFAVEKGYERHPVIYVSWYGAKAYCDWLSKKTGRQYRLPTEAEWEYAARGGQAGLKDNFEYAGSNTLGEVGWYNRNSDGQAHRVGEKDNNQLGLYDMSGNIFEWCADWYAAYPTNAQTDPKGPNTGELRVFRGGSWSIGARFCRSANRFHYVPTGRDNLIGFRLALQ